MDSKLKTPPEITDGQDTPEEYRFSNPGPTAPPKRNFWIGADGHIHVKNLSAFWLPDLPYKRRLAARFTPSLAVMTVLSR